MSLVVNAEMKNAVSFQLILRAFSHMNARNMRESPSACYILTQRWVGVHHPHPLPLYLPLS